MFPAFLLVSLVFSPATASAQGQTTPDTGLAAVGASLGTLFPDATLEPAITLEGFGEYYLGPRVSVRGLLGFVSPGFDGRTEDRFRQLRLIASAVYNWEFGAWHPFAAGGVGAYFVREKRDGATDPEGETRGGVSFGGGVEYFTGPRAAVKGEMRWDVVSHPSGFPDATGLTVSVGYKRYF